jgi:hypothetical protein
MKTPTFKPNVGRGPTTGNKGTPSKRSAFESEKGSGSASADIVMKALENRGASTESYMDAGVEPLSPNRGPKSNKTAGGTKYTVTPKKNTKL